MIGAGVSLFETALRGPNSITPPAETVVPSYVAKYEPGNGTGEKTLTNDGGTPVQVTLATGDLLLLYLNTMSDGINDPGVPTLAWGGGSDAFTSVGEPCYTRWGRDCWIASHCERRRAVPAT